MVTKNRPLRRGPARGRSPIRFVVSDREGAPSSPNGALPLPGFLSLQLECTRRVRKREWHDSGVSPLLSGMVVCAHSFPAADTHIPNQMKSHLIVRFGRCRWRGHGSYEGAECPKSARKVRKELRVAVIPGLPGVAN